MGGQSLPRRASAAAVRRNSATVTCTKSVSKKPSIEIRAKDPRYHRDAYLFVREALDYTQKAIGKDTRGRIRHVTGQELLAGIREYALAQFGPMAITVFEEWGVHAAATSAKSSSTWSRPIGWPRPTRTAAADFAGGYDFDEAFRKPFLPEEQASHSSA